jgi:cytochrome b561
MLLGFMLVPSASAASYVVDHDISLLSFTGTHAGDEFTGVFTDWSADIEFDDKNLDASHVRVTIKTESATTDNKMYDGTLPQKDWFNVKKFPEASFVSKSFEKQEDGSYLAVGDLTIKDITHPVSFGFSLTDLSRSDVVMDAMVTLNRLDFELGKKSDPEAEWVSKDIQLKIHLLADME